MDRRDLLRRTGEALYGERWQSALARELHLNERTIRSYLSGRDPIPDWLWAELRKLVIERGARLAALARELLRVD